MKKLLLLLFLASCSFGAKAQSTATDFTANDCNSVSHNLFSELNAGKVIVLVWVMPCSACVGACQNAQTIAASYTVSNPNQVKFYVADDYGTSSCSTLGNWVTTNNIVSDAIFTNSVISMSNYGVAGMPKLVVLAGIATHSVYYNQNNSNIVLGNVQAAVNLALSDLQTASVKETTQDDLKMNISPSPATNNLHLNFVVGSENELSFEIMNLLGQSCKQQNMTCGKGKNSKNIDISELQNGVYFLKVSDGKNSSTTKFIKH